MSRRGEPSPRMRAQAARERQPWKAWSGRTHQSPFVSRMRKSRKTTYRHPRSRALRPVPPSEPPRTGMKICLHGYLLGGTGSNVYTRARARVEPLEPRGDRPRAGPHPDRFDLAGAKVVRPELDGPLPVFVLDRYEGHEPKLLQDFTREERDRYVEVNAAALASTFRRTSSSRTTCSGWAGSRRDRRPVRGQGARLRARVLRARKRRARPGRP